MADTTISVNLSGLEEVTASLESTVASVTSTLSTKLSVDKITSKLEGLNIGAQLACGKALAIDALNDVRAQIKAKLKEGLGVWGDLGKLMEDAKAKFEAVKGKINSAMESFKNDL